MSFILDALKKSEAERQRQSLPGLLDLPAQTPKPRFPVWGIWLGSLLGVNLLVLLVVLIRSSGSPPVAPAAAPNASAAPMNQAAAARSPAAALSSPAIPGSPVAAAPAATPSPAPAVDGTGFSPMDSQPVYAPEIPVAETTGPQPTAIPGPAMDYAAAASTPPAAREPVPPQPRIPPDPGEVVPTLQEVQLSGNHGIPELHLDIHVYAAKPADRFVFINSRKYREGSTLQEGPAIERITRDGVVLNYRNLRFSIPRQ